MSAGKLKSALDSVLAKAAPGGSLAPQPDGTTYCNVAVCDAGRALGLVDWDPNTHTANRIAAICAADTSGWSVVDSQGAADAALAGRWVLACAIEAKHGHVASVYPAPAQMSQTWGHVVPMVANVGKSVGIMRASGAFRMANQPSYYVFSQGA